MVSNLPLTSLVLKGINEYHLGNGIYTLVQNLQHLSYLDLSHMDLCDLSLSMLTGTYVDKFTLARVAFSLKEDCAENDDDGVTGIYGPFVMFWMLFHLFTIHHNCSDRRLLLFQCVLVLRVLFVQIWQRNGKVEGCHITNCVTKIYVFVITHFFIMHN